MTLASRLSLTMVAVVVIAVTTVSVLEYRRLELVVLPSQLRVLQQEAESLATLVEGVVLDIRNDLQAIAAAPAVDEFIRAQAAGGDADAARQRVEQLFLPQLQYHPTYLQLRLIGRAQEGREIVRVERSASGVAKIIPQSALQNKGQRPYMRMALETASGTVYASPIELNQEHGAIVQPFTPVLRVACAIRVTPDAEPFGIVVINVDMRPIFDQLRQRTQDHGKQLRILDERGQWLVHPDPELEFGMERGHDDGRRDNLAGRLTEQCAADGSSSVLLPGTAEEQALAVAVASIRPAQGSRITAILTVPAETVDAWISSARPSGVLAALIVSLAATGLAFVTSRTLTRPLAQMTASVEKFAAEQPTTLPLNAGGEIGVLARAFAKMATTVEERSAQLRHEIVERRRAQERVERNAKQNQLLGAVVESSQDAIITLTGQGQIMTWNRGAEKIFGYTEQEAVNQSLELVVPGERHKDLARMLDAIREGRSIEQLETVSLHKNGAEIDLSISVSPLREVGGKLIGAATIARDVTDRRRSEERFRLAVEASPNGLIIADREGTIEVVNTEVERLFGYQSSQLIGKCVDMLVNDRDRSEHPRLRAAYCESPTMRKMGGTRELYARRSDGSEFPVEVGLTPLPSRSGLLILSVIIDISERKLIDAERERQNKELQRSNEELEQFAYVASHDLREPLRMVSSFAELLAARYRGQLDDQADKYIRYMVEGTERMKQMVRDLLTFAQVGTQGKPFQPVDINKTVRDVLHTLKQTIDGSNAQIEIETLPLVLADRSQLEQVFQNLIGNALKFRSQAPPELHVGSRSIGDGHCELFVRDNGIGMDMSYAERVFQMFQRLHDRASFDGNGIGLAIVKKIVERHGGEIRFTSELGKGTTFFFTLREATSKEV